MKSRLPTAMAVTLLMTLGACDNDNNSRPPPPPPPPPAATSSVEVLHASPDAPAVNVRVDGVVVLEDVPYKAGSGLLTVEAGTIEVEVEAIVPSGTATVIGPASVEVAPDERVTVIAIGKTADIQPLVLNAPDADLAAGNARVRVVHAAPDAPLVDVYATAPGEDLATAAPLGTFAFGEDLGPVEIPEGTYQIRVTPAGDAATVVYDSGNVGVPAGADLVIVAVANTGPGAAPISLVALDGTGTAEILDVATPAALRVVHASPNAPAVDVVANDDFVSRAVVDLAFPEITDYVEPPAGDINVKVVPTGLDAPVVIDANLTLDAGVSYTVLAVGELAAIEPLVLVDDTRRIATEARARIVHASPTAGPVDIYVTEPGAGIDAATPAFAAVEFKAETGYVPLAAGSYDVTVTPAGSKVAAIGPVTLDLDAGGIYTAAARDQVGGGVPLGLILMDDLAAP